MRRILVVLLGPALVGAFLAVPPAQAVVAGSSFEIYFVADEGPAPAAGTRLHFDARLVSGGDPVAGVPVTLEAKPYGGTSFVSVGHGTTGADGSVQVVAVLRQSSVIRWEFAGQNDYAPSTSFPYLRPIGRRVPARAADSSLQGRQKLVVLGSARPLSPGRSVSLWRGDVPSMAHGPSPVRIAVGRIGRDGSFRLTARFAQPGARKLFVKVAAGGGNAASYSRYLRIQVR